MGRVRRNWTTEEDDLLRKAVQRVLGQSRPLLWRELAKEVPGRSNKDCRRRWWNSLAQGLTRGPWSEEEDAKLISAVQQHGTNWSQVASLVNSRNSDQCASHWSQVLDPDINFCDWVQSEDECLLHEVLTHGTNWAVIAGSHTPRRTTLALKNRYSALRLRHDNQTAKIDRQNSDESNQSQSFVHHADGPDADDSESDILEANESGPEDHTDCFDTSEIMNAGCGEVSHLGHIIPCEVDDSFEEIPKQKLDGASQAEQFEVAHGAFFQQPSAGVSMENWVSGVFDMQEPAKLNHWGPCDPFLVPGNQDVESHCVTIAQEIGTLMTPPETIIDEERDRTSTQEHSYQRKGLQKLPQATTSLWKGDNHSHSPKDARGDSYQLSFELFCSSEQLGDIMSKVVGTGKCTNVRITNIHQRRE
ncbi:hypothetical protein F4808DRAFT_414565 [Astrocystis sublimbata]|nr:hypothetical protein F4808DRAFT_414565 [Astrocystis sublimbata]